MKSLKQHITEAKEMSKEVAIAVLKQIQKQKAHDGPVTMSKMHRDNIHNDIPGVKFTRDVPNPRKGALFGTILGIALGGKDSYYFDDADLVKGDKTLFPDVLAKGSRATFGSIAKAAGVKL